MPISLSRPVALLSLCCALLGGGAAQAQSYPARPIRIQVPFSPGGAQDVIIRLLSQKVSGNLGQSLLIENKAGAGGLIAADAVAKAAPDGYTLLMASGGQVSVAAAARTGLNYDPQKDLVAIVQLVDTPMVLVVPEAMPVANLAEFIALAKQKPGVLTFASTGTGTISHLTGEALKHAAGINVVHIPYKGAAQGLNDLLSGQVNAMFTSAASAHAHLASKRLRALAVTSGERLPSLPEVPTFAEAGLKGFAIPVWAGLMAPRGVAPEVVQRLNSEYLKVLQEPALRQQLQTMGAIVVGSTPAQFAETIQDDIARWKQVVTRGNLKLD
ncbi:tripartite tricarboxylate transporter substrate binding protein [Verminephrobacter aporrectodeae subsp. tuberculatae]|uniref:Bug family tripartite tricarboxylate transporter substrate binding protein n=1 Tax=Verminephrobacter aporrectodeae TaxID=1110389 RepID=UPI0002376178|nr:tripartite tricarboxylate transporter substrate binding protein [Verminephrobacter aporrectodeae]MCW8198485.1 tripartite tricarboxylate transporter substrate binding protein [Verminephrobacter aporrectodeae subsp. tuberculatae]